MLTLTTHHKQKLTQNESLISKKDKAMKLLENLHNFEIYKD